MVSGSAYAGVLVALASCLAGCVRHQQVQHFAVRDPDTGATNYYRMTIKGGNNATAVKYQMQAGYFSAAAVDILRGQMPKIPQLDLDPAQQEVFDALLNEFYGSLLDEARRKTGGAGEDCLAEGVGADDEVIAAKDAATLEEQALYLARLVWLGSLSASDVASVGMTQHTNPYQFRKLVFWTTVQNIDINEFATQIDGIIEQVTSLGLAFKEIAKARAAEREQRQAGQEQRGRAIWEALTGVAAGNPLVEPLGHALGLHEPSEAGADAGSGSRSGDSDEGE